MNATPFPAILIGGPPHSGKSVLVYNLTRALRVAHIPHYVLRACPDGEGDWANEAEQVVVQTLRSKGPYSAAFIDSVATYLRKRHLPLLVDVGGQPTAEQEAVFGHCTHAILLIGERGGDSEAYAIDTATWYEIAKRQQLPIIAQIKSLLHGTNHLVSTSPIITGTISGLERGAFVTGQIFEALVEKISELFAFSDVELAARHLAQAPEELSLDLPALARTLGSPDGRWAPRQLPDLLDYLPEQKPLALYGRAPNWLYAALAMIAFPEPIWLFDARLGWIQPPALPQKNDIKPRLGWEIKVRDHNSFTLLEIDTHSQYLDIEKPSTLPIPVIHDAQGLVLSGKIPHWLTMAIARQLTPFLSWIAIYQPQISGAVVIFSQSLNKHLGEIIPIQRRLLSILT